ncbi:MAG: phosphatidylglycerophosphatase A [Planctomycetaceae bacterium]|nr:phosphatidylglycerophosphatase A [Planctomycetaceae bacterium]
MENSGASKRLSASDKIILLLGEGFGLGRVPKAPGTFGSLWGILIGWGFWKLDVHLAVRLAVFAVMFVPGISICSRCASLRGKKDPGSVVWDEMTAFPLVYSLLSLNWWWLLAGFGLFRLFDITKPWPIRSFERLPGGLGIMADDQIAGLYAGVILYVAQVILFAS